MRLETSQFSWVKSSEKSLADFKDRQFMAPTESHVESACYI